MEFLFKKKIKIMMQTLGKTTFNWSQRLDVNLSMLLYWRYQERTIQSHFRFIPLQRFLDQSSYPAGDQHPFVRKRTCLQLSFKQGHFEQDGARGLLSLARGYAHLVDNAYCFRHAQQVSPKQKHPITIKLLFPLIIHFAFLPLLDQNARQIKPLKHSPPVLKRLWESLYWMQEGHVIRQ